MIEIYVDGDACPVKDEILRVAERHNLIVHLVSNQWLRLPVGPNVNKVVVSDGFDAADDWIADTIQPHDIAITSDIPLAKRCLEKSAYVLGPTGKPFTPDNIAMAMAMRELNQDLRAMGEIKGYNAAFAKKDRSNFLNEIERTIHTAIRARRNC